jgi:hypothetical protein
MKMSMNVEFKPTVRVVVGVLKEWIDEHNIVVTSDDGESEYDFDLGGFEIETNKSTEGHIEEGEDDLCVGDTVMVTVVEHLVVLKRAKKTKEK